MDKLRKIGMWIWQNKERLVLGLLVVVLSYQVYKVVSQKVEIPDPPGPVALDWKAPEVPLPPPAPAPENYNSLHQRNPFWYFSSPAKAEGTAEGEEDNIQLLDIQRARDGGYTAQIYTIAAKWYREGEQFESYQLLRIDPQKQEVEVYSGKSGTTLVLRMQ